ncbi:hypothetical protein E5288_WYG016077 [Bos mutus]|uniref:Uncharacterized protein n=1 Tax=Bos mutus TaxID=72004 RepID=A0A6B0RNA9_9CETA|nr:hypothetical protein [Bos mutus]
MQRPARQQKGLGRRGQGFLPVESGRVGPGGAGVRNPLPAGRSSEASRASAPLGSAVTWPPELHGGLTRWGRPRDCPAAPLAGAGQGLTAGESPRWCQRLARASRVESVPRPKEERGGVCGVVLYALLHIPLSNWQCVPRTFYLKHFERHICKKLNLGVSGDSDLRSAQCSRGWTEALPNAWEFFVGLLRFQQSFVSVSHLHVEKKESGGDSTRPWSGGPLAAPWPLLPLPWGWGTHSHDAGASRPVLTCPQVRLASRRVESGPCDFCAASVEKPQARTWLSPWPWVGSESPWRPRPSA